MWLGLRAQFWLRTWNQTFFFYFRAGKFWSAAPNSEREPDGVRPAHTRVEAAARLFVGSFALPMERERAKPLEGRAAAAHVGCCVWFYPFCRVEQLTRPNPSADFPPFNASSNAHPQRPRAADKPPCIGGLSAVIKMGGCSWAWPLFLGGKLPVF